MTEQVNHPSHYTQGGIECIDAIQAALTADEFVGFLKGQVLKYIWRAGHKDTSDILTDSHKAEWYNKRLREFVILQREKANAVMFVDEPTSAEPSFFAIQYFPICPVWHKGLLDGLENWTEAGWYIVECNEFANQLHPDHFVSRQLAHDKIDGYMKHFHAIMDNIVNLT